ncbi:hypothetical protein SAMN05660236_0482 [Ohtaekwangia koreensis]|uniref:Uncharacterized protein n=1 Tax=Ohtaekwangia koreensis TaxID=688867 RepID=A0A1T5IWP3_9BACT|nr:hypothetical protein SAMN05660236_0482 [Ohtaekwangia koreensis]
MGKAKASETITTKKKANLSLSQRLVGGVEACANSLKSLFKNRDGLCIYPAFGSLAAFTIILRAE